MSGNLWCYPHQNYNKSITTSDNTNMSSSNEAVILIAKFDYQKKDSQELDLKKNERLVLLDNSKKWWLVQKFDKSETGYVPSNYVKKEKRSLLDKLMPKKSKRVNSITSSTDIDKDLSNLNIDNNTNNNSIIQSDISSENLNLSNSSEFNKKQKAIVKYKYSAKKNDEITLVAGTIVTVLEKYEDGWWRVEVNGNFGLYPSNYLEDINMNQSIKISNNENKSNSNDSSQSITSMNNNNNNNNNNIKPQNTLFAAKTLEYIQAIDDNSINNNNNNNSSSSSCKIGVESISSNENDTEYVRVIYAYTAKNDNELTVNVDEMLRVIDDEINLNNKHDSTNLWTKVMNSRGMMGLIPSNCVQPCVDNINLMRKPIENHLFPDNKWYFGNISRQETNLLLNKYGKIGDFIVRDCERDAGNFSISLKSDNQMNKHFKVLYKDNCFMIGKKTFNIMDDLLCHYKKHPIFDQNPEKLYLVKPIELPYLT